MKRLRLDLRLAAAALLALLAGLGVLSLTRPPDRVTVLVTAEPLPAGVVLADAPLRELEVEPVEGMLLAAERQGLAAWTIDVPTPAGSPLTHAMLAPPSGDRPDLLALTLERAHAVQGLLSPGDRVDLYVTDDAGTRLIAGGIQIVAVSVDEGGLGAGDVSMTLGVHEPDLVAQLIAAMRSAAIDLALVSP